MSSRYIAPYTKPRPLSRAEQKTLNQLEDLRKENEELREFIKNENIRHMEQESRWLDLLNRAMNEVKEKTQLLKKDEQT